MTHADEHPDPDAGFTLTHLGYGLYWQRNEAGGRTYHSDEIPCGVFVWDTCLIEMATLCEAIAMEIALLGAERRQQERAFRDIAAATGADKAFDQPHHGHSNELPEGFVAFDGDTLPDGLRGTAPQPKPPPMPSARPAALLHVRQLIEQLQRAHKQLLRYSLEDPVATEIGLLLLNGPKRPEGSK